MQDSELQLSQNALNELKTILEKDIGKDALNALSEADINRFGCLLLTLTASALKRHIKETTHPD